MELGLEVWLEQLGSPFDKFYLGMCDWTDCLEPAMMENMSTVDATHTQPMAILQSA